MTTRSDTRPGDNGRMRFGEALVAGDDLVAAATQAATEAVAALDDVPDLACVFVCGDDPEQVATAGCEASEITGARAVVGCSAGGVIGGGRAVEGAASVSVWVAVLPGLRLRTFHLDVLRGNESLAVLGMPEPQPDDVVAVLLADPVAVSTIVSQGTRPIGPAMTVTEAEGNLLLGLAGAPALEKVRRDRCDAAAPRPGACGRRTPDRHRDGRVRR